MSNDYLKPKAGAPGLDRKKRNGQFVNPPSYAEMGGLTGPSKLMRGKSNMDLEKGGPKSKLGQPI